MANEFDNGSERTSGTRSWLSLLEVASTAAVLVAALLMIWQSSSRFFARASPLGRAPSVPTALQPFGDAYLKGDPQAPLALIIYGDFQCPYCGRFARDVWPTIDDDYVSTGRVLTIFRHLPLEGVHPHAIGAAEAAECAGKQGRFWEMHDALFRSGASLDEAGLLEAAALAAVDVEMARDCMTNDTAVRAKVRADAAAARQLEVTSTPTFFIGMRSGNSVQVSTVLRGARTLPSFVSAFDQAEKKVMK